MLKKGSYKKIIRKKNKSEPNTKGKIRNATKVTYNGINFKSKLELFAYKEFLKEKINVKYEGTTFEIIPKFEYNGEKIRSMSFTPDFVGDGFICEIKGFCNDAFPLRYKIFKYYLLNNNIKLDLYLPHNQIEVKECVQQIKNKLNGRSGKI